MIIKRKLENIKLEPIVVMIIEHLQSMGLQSLVVGGAVRDALLNIVPKDIDVEVYNTSYDTLKSVLEKYGSVDLVGQAFGVIKFNPKEGNMSYDFSIPRKENKVGVKRQDFEMQFDEKMTVKEASMRRDFTMNSLAYDPITFEIHDYFGGLMDIESMTIRHTSTQFTEDALRILRAMQFQSRFGFTVHGATYTLMREMSDSGEFESIPKERIFEEWLKWAKKGVHHAMIFVFMRKSGLIKYYPELSLLRETEQDKIYHPEGDVEIHTELCLLHMDKVIKRERISGEEKVILILATLLHDIAKPQTTEEKFKHGRMIITSEGHEGMGGEMCVDLLSKWGFHEALYLPISKLVANHLAGVNISHVKKPSSQMKSVKKLSKRLFPANIKQLLYVMEADSNGRGGDETVIPTGAEIMLELADKVQVIEKPYEFILMGRHLIEKGMKPSRLFGTILDRAGEAQIEGEFEELIGAKKWLNENLKEFTE